MIWRPDTCGCVLEYSGRNDVPANFVRAIVACPAHPAAQGETVLVENQIRQQMMEQIVRRAPQLATLGGVVDESKVSFSFDANRDLVISASSLTTAEKLALRAALAAHALAFSPGAPDLQVVARARKPGIIVV